VEQIIMRYGVVAIFCGAGIEGEPFALAGGVLAQRHWLPITAAVLAAAGGAYLVDQSWFHTSRYFRESRLIGRIRRRPAFGRALALIERRPVWFALLFRFAYGMRAVAPVAVGASKVPTRLFMPLNLIAAIVWGILFTALGYRLGPAFEMAFAHYGARVAVGAVCVSILVLFLVLRRDR